MQTAGHAGHAIYLYICLWEMKRRHCIEKESGKINADLRADFDWMPDMLRNTPSAQSLAFTNTGLVVSRSPSGNRFSVVLRKTGLQADLPEIALGSHGTARAGPSCRRHRRLPRMASSQGGADLASHQPPPHPPAHTARDKVTA